jgi:N-formylglutamate deformylase
MNAISRPDVIDIPALQADPAPVVLDSPHSGTDYPADFRFAIDPAILRYGVDMDIDDIFGSAPAFGASLISARFPRSYIDPNRSPLDIDPEMIDGNWPGEIEQSEKTASGHGLIWRVAGAEQAPIYDRKLTVAEVQNRIDYYWRVYRDAVSSKLDETAKEFGGYWHINCHSMPTLWPPGFAGAGEPVPFDMIIGTRDNTTCSPEVAHFARDLLAGLGFSVAVNVGFKGVDLVRDHGDPANRRHSLQIEINRGVYMDEATFERSEGYEPLRDAMTQFVEAFVAEASTHFGLSARSRLKRFSRTS